MAFPAEEWRLATYAIVIGQPEPGLYEVMKPPFVREWS